MFDAANSTIIGGWSFIVSIIELLISVAGFTITIWQLKDAMNATSAVETALSHLKNRMATFDYTSECMRAAKGFEHSIQLLRSGNLADAAGRLLEAQGSLNRVANSEEGSRAVKDEAGAMISQLLDAIQVLEEAADKGLAFDGRDLILTLRKQINALETDSFMTQKGLYNA